MHAVNCADGSAGGGELAAADGSVPLMRVFAAMPSVLICNCARRTNLHSALLARIFWLLALFCGVEHRRIICPTHPRCSQVWGGGKRRIHQTS